MTEHKNLLDQKEIALFIEEELKKQLISKRKYALKNQKSIQSFTQMFSDLKKGNKNIGIIRLEEVLNDLGYKFEIVKIKK